MLLSTHLDDLLGFRERGFGVERESRVDLGRNVSRDNLGDFHSKVHSDLVLSLQIRRHPMKVGRKRERERGNGKTPAGVAKSCGNETSDVPWQVQDLPWRTWQHHPRGERTAPSQRPGSEVKVYVRTRGRNKRRHDRSWSTRRISSKFCTHLVDQRRIGRGILRFQALDRFDVSSVTDDDGVFLELVELAGHGC
jgi:hypothetical protein